MNVADSARGHSDPRRWAYAAFAAFLLLVGIAIFLTVLLNAFRWGGPAAMRLGGPWAMVFGVFGLLILLVFVLAIAFFAMRGLARAAWRGSWHRPDGGRWGFDPALEIARSRYARGEITREQYDALRRDLESSPDR